MVETALPQQIGHLGEEHNDNKTWTGGHPGYNARNPQNWTPYGAPQAGDTLRMVSGRMDIDYASLPGELRLGPGNQLSTGPITLNMVWSNATVGAEGRRHFSELRRADPLTINAYGQDHLTADNLQAVEGTVNIAANSDLVVTGRMAFSYFDHLRAPPAPGREAQSLITAPSAWRQVIFPPA